MANKDSKLRVFLRNAPQPAKVRMRKGDEEQDVALAEALRHRWRMAEEACLSWGAESVECLDSKGAILRVFTIEREDDDERSERKIITAKGAEYRGLSEVIDRIAERHNEAFQLGSEAASHSQAQLVDLVQILTVHLTTAITSIYNVSERYAAILQGNNPDDAAASGSQAAMANLIGAALARLGQGFPAPAAPPPKPNGKG